MNMAYQQTERLKKLWKSSGWQLSHLIVTNGYSTNEVKLLTTVLKHQSLYLDVLCHLIILIQMWMNTTEKQATVIAKPYSP